METKRLILRNLVPDDALNLYKLNLNTDVIRFTGDVAFESIKEAKLFIENYNHYSIYGYGRWAVIEKKSNEFIGWCGLRYLESKKEVDIGFRFLRQHWSKGYATEAANFCVNLGFKKFGIPEIIGRTMIKNKASIKVLEKIGMVRKNQETIENESWVFYFKTPNFEKLLLK